MSLLATLISVFTASAQENTYSMVIKMQNGTVLTIGPNEADSIFFDEGKLNVSGQSIKDIMKRLDFQDADIKSITKDVYAIEAETMTVKDMANVNKNDIKALKDMILSQQNMINDLQKTVVGLSVSLDALKANSAAQQNNINYLVKDNNLLKAKIEALEAVVNELMNK